MLTATGLSCVRGDRLLFSELDFMIEPGMWLHVQGENGSGKTSLLRILAGLSPPAAGEIRWRGELIRELAEDYRRELLFIGHQGAVKDDLTPLENLGFAAQLDGVRFDTTTALSSLASFGLHGREDLPVRFLSAGQKRRVLLAQLIVRKAALWILDEPFTALDARAVEMLSELLAKHLEAHGLVILTSHQPMRLPNGKVTRL